MPTKQTITLLQGDDPMLALAVTLGGAAYDLTGQRVEILVKERHQAEDVDALYVLSSAGVSPKITLDAPLTLGTGTADFTDRLANAGTFWYRAYVADAANAALNRHTFAYGDLVILSV